MLSLDCRELFDAKKKKGGSKKEVLGRDVHLFCMKSADAQSGIRDKGPKSLPLA